jgi:beta-lactamase regulating signal transducer with metallopeptidase domain
VWTLAVCGLLALPLLSSAVPALRLSWLTVRPEAPAPAKVMGVLPAVVVRPPAEAGSFASDSWGWETPGSTAPASTMDRSEAPSSAGARESSAATVRIDSTSRTIGLGTLALAVYLAGVLALLGRLALGMWSVRRLARRAEALTDAAWTGMVRDLCWLLEISRPVTLLRSADAAMPMTWGTRRPAVLLPAEAEGWSEERRKVVLLHELAHVARGDCLTQTLASLACALWWFHPGAWHAARRLRVERELACDDAVLAAGTRAREYAAHLLEVARAFRPAPLTGAAAISMARPSQLEGRLLAVLDSLRSRSAPTRAAAAAAAAGALALILPLSALRPAEAGAVAPRSAARALAGAQMAAFTQEGDFVREIDVRAGSRLELDLQAGTDVKVVAWDRSAVRVSAGRDPGVRLEAVRVDGGVRVTSRAVRGGAGDGPTLEVRVPRRFDVSVESHGGGVEIRGVAGTFTGSTRGGGLGLVRASGRVDMGTQGGGAFVSESRLDGLLLTQGGGVMIDNDGGLELDTQGGAVVGSADGWDAADAHEDAYETGEEVELDVADGEEDESASAHGHDDGVVESRDGGVVTISRAGGAVQVSEAPRGARLATGGGDVRVGRARGFVEATTGGGDVTVASVDGAARVATGSGDVDVRVTGRGGDVAITSGNGDVTLTLPDDFSGELVIESAYTRGRGATRITSDFPLRVRESDAWDDSRGTPRRTVRGTARLGSGRNRVVVSTVNGNVHLRRASSGARSSSGARVSSGARASEARGSRSRARGSSASSSRSGLGVSCEGTTCRVRDGGRSREVTVDVSDLGELVGNGIVYALGDTEARKESLRQIARHASPEVAAVTLLGLANADAETEVQVAAVDALRTVRGTAAAGALREIAREHPSAEVRRAASRALRRR